MELEKEIMERREREIFKIESFMEEQLFGFEKDLSFYNSRIDGLEKSMKNIKNDSSIKEREANKKIKELKKRIDRIKKLRETAGEEFDVIKSNIKDLTTKCDVKGDKRDINGYSSNELKLYDIFKVIDDKKCSDVFKKESSSLKEQIRKNKDALMLEIEKSKEKIRFSKYFGEHYEIKITSLEDFRNILGINKFEDIISKNISKKITDLNSGKDNQLIDLKKEELKNVKIVRYVNKQFEKQEEIVNAASRLIPEINALDKVISSYRSNIELIKEISDVKKIYEEAAMHMLKSKYADIALTIIQDERYFSKTISNLQRIVHDEKKLADGLKAKADEETVKKGIDKQIQAIIKLEQIKLEYGYLDEDYMSIVHSTKDQEQMLAIKAKMEELNKLKKEILSEFPQFSAYDFKTDYREKKEEKIDYSKENLEKSIQEEWKENIDDKLYNNESLAIKRTQYYQKYLHEKMINPETANIPFSEYLQSKVPDSELIEIEKERETKTQTIYMEYIKYLASMPDKNKALKFNEFALKRYQIENIEKPIELENQERSM